MIKAIFLDYTGTVVQDSGAEIKETVMRICQNSDLRDPRKVMVLWWKLVKGYEESSYGDTYLTEDEIVDRALQYLVETVHLRENLAELHGLIQQFWVRAPLFPDARELFAHCPCPIYMISNNGVQYVGRSMEEKNLSPAGIVCADMVRAYKPHRELFEKALEVSGCKAGEVIHVGDSYVSDVRGAQAAGIRPILIQRTRQTQYSDVEVIESLGEILPLCQEKKVF